MKVIRTYEYLLYDRADEVEDNRDQKQNQLNDLNNEINSTRSFLEELSVVSRTEDDYIENGEAMLTSRQLAKEFENLENFATSTTISNQSVCGKTFNVIPNQFGHSSDSGRCSTDGDSKCNQRVTSSPDSDKKCSNVSEDGTREQLQIPTQKDASSDEVNSDLIYDRIDDNGFDNKKNWHKIGNIATENARIESELILNCNHKFIHQTASPPVDCSLCLKT